MLEKSFRRRTSQRMVPRKSVTVALYEEDTPVTYGAIINLSPQGACFASGTPLQPGTRCFLKFSFYGHPVLFETWARIIWREDGYKLSGAITGLQVHGIEFSSLNEGQRANLEERLDSEEFELASAPSFSEFESVKSELSEMLDRLGAKLEDPTGCAD